MRLARAPHPHGVPGREHRWVGRPARRVDEDAVVTGDSGGAGQVLSRLDPDPHDDGLGGQDGPVVQPDAGDGAMRGPLDGIRGGSGADPDVVRLVKGDDPPGDRRGHAAPEHARPCLDDLDVDPRVAAAAATSSPITPPPTTTRRRTPPRAWEMERASAVSRRWCTPGPPAPGTVRRRGSAPGARSTAANDTFSPAAVVTVRPIGSIATTGVRVRTSMRSRHFAPGGQTSGTTASAWSRSSVERTVRS